MSHLKLMMDEQCLHHEIRWKLITFLTKLEFIAYKRYTQNIIQLNESHRLWIYPVTLMSCADLSCCRLERRQG